MRGENRLGLWGKNFDGLSKRLMVLEEAYKEMEIQLPEEPYPNKDAGFLQRLDLML